MVKVFSYLKGRPNGKIICDSSYPDHSQYKSEDHDNWKDFYPDAEEDIPPDLPNQYGKPLRITCCVDADHAHCKLTRRYVTGIVLFVNNMPIRWMDFQETEDCGNQYLWFRIGRCQDCH